VIYKLLNCLSSLLKLLPLKLRYVLYELNTTTNLKIQIAFRYCIVASICKQTGRNIYIGKHVSLKNIEHIEIGNNVSIHDMCYIDGYGGIKIGNDVSIAHATSILSSSHTWQDSSLPIKYNDVIKGPVNIGNDVWIGCGTRILSNITIEDRTVVAAGTVANKNLITNHLGAGVPMQIKKKLEEH
jgi:acetyltransferase-like isoleucine patch superfamily enzyme